MTRSRLARGIFVGLALTSFGFSAGSPGIRAQSTPAAAPGPQWATYGSNLASHRYSPLDQITADNFDQLEIAWRLGTDFLGPRRDTLYSATPLFVDGVLYTTAGTRRAAIALNAATGEMLWMHSEDEGVRGQNAPRSGAGRARRSAACLPGMTASAIPRRPREMRGQPRSTPSPGRTRSAQRRLFSRTLRSQAT